MDFPLLSFGFIAFALVNYLVLDGFDLGVGALLLFRKSEGDRDQMIESITPTWDGNETWLIMAGISLFAAFPIAYGILMPAFYLPVVTMLVSLGLRGVSFEFRRQPAAARLKWDRIFAAGSIGASLAQGFIVGGLLSGVTVEHRAFHGGAYDWFTTFSCLTALTQLAGYGTLGAAWLYYRSESETRTYVGNQLKWLPLLFAAMATAVLVWLGRLQPEVVETWKAHIALVATAGTIFLLITVALSIFVRLGRTGYDWLPFVLVLGLFACISGIVVSSIFPDVVPFRVSLWDAASTTQSHVFLLTGALVVTPVVIGYNAFAYWVFRGKTPNTGLDP